MKLEPGPDYIKGMELIELLRSEPELKEIVLPELFDEEDQASLIKAAANSSQGLITVTPFDINNNAHVPHRAGRVILDTPYALAAWTTTNATLCPEGFTSNLQYQSALIYALIKLVGQWKTAPPGAGESQSPKVVSIGPPFTLEKLPNLYGRLLTITVPLVY